MAQKLAAISALFCLMSSLVGLLRAEQTGATNRKLLVLLIDGFRWDYFNKFQVGELPGFERLIENGVKAEYMEPVFPSLSFVNYYSMMTGLYPGIHGQVNNYMYDPVHDSEFLAGDNRPEQDRAFWWDDGEPLWITARRQNKRSALWYWNGCEVEIRGLRPDFCSPYQDNPDPSMSLFREAVHNAAANLSRDLYDFAGVYYQKLDSVGHEEGPDGPGIRQTILELDQVMLDLLTWTDNAGLTDNLDIIVFSDHGMSEVPANNSINLLDYISNEDIFKAVNTKDAPVMQLWPTEGKLDEVYAALERAHPNMSVFRREDIPERYHLKEHYRVPPLLVVADEGFAILKPNRTSLRYRGYHGYDNSLPDMRTLFIASGPDFVNGSVKSGFEIENIEVYQLMCSVLEIEPAPNNGTWTNICGILSDVDACFTSSSAPSITSSSSTVVIIMSLVVTLIRVIRLM